VRSTGLTGVRRYSPEASKRRTCVGIARLASRLSKFAVAGHPSDGVMTPVLFIPSCPGYTSLTGALDQSDRCEPFVGFALGELLNPCVFGLCWCWSVLGKFWRCFGWLCVGFFFRASCVLRVLLFQGLEKSLKLSGTFVVRLL
jgi:hypothetical protein